MCVSAIAYCILLKCKTVSFNCKRIFVFFFFLEAIKHDGEFRGGVSTNIG